MLQYIYKANHFLGAYPVSEVAFKVQSSVMGQNPTAGIAYPHPQLA